MTNLLIRDLTTDEHTALTTAAKSAGQSLSRYVAELIRQDISEPPLNLGWIQIDRVGDIDTDNSECVDCNQRLSAPMFVALISDGSHYGPVCQWCANSE